MALRVFLSYGHDEHVAVAALIREALERRGHEVWQDTDRLHLGEGWELLIERGLDWVAEDLDRGRVVLLMTPYSVRRPEGYCLNELARALERRVKIVPVMLVSVEPPLSITRVQRFDMTMCLPLSGRNELVERRTELLVDQIEAGQASEKSETSALLHVLQPISFDAELRAGTADYVERAHVISAVDRWVRDPDAGSVFWLAGAPGTGKTSVSLHLAATRREVGAWHFCQYGHVLKADPRRCIMSIAYQLATQLPEYSAQLARLDLDSLVTAENTARTLFDLLLLQPLSRVPDPDRTVVVIVDGLDEATVSGSNELVS